MSDFTRADLYLPITAPTPDDAHAAKVTLAEQALRAGETGGLVEVLLMVGVAGEWMGAVA